MTTLHITNGDSAAQGMTASGIAETIVPWRDVLHDGPVPPDRNRRAFRAVRAEFLARMGEATPESIMNDMMVRDDIVDACTSDDSVILWFEPDLYDQLQLAQVLARYAEREESDRPQLFVVPADTLLGPLEPARFPPLLLARRQLGDADVRQGARAWSALTDENPEALVAMAREPQPAPRTRNFENNPEIRLPYLNSALQRLLEEYPAKINGLSRTEQQICETLALSERTLAQCYPVAHHESEEWVWLGDWSFASYVETIGQCERPLVARTDGAPMASFDSRDYSAFWSQAVCLTPFGRDVVEGRADHVSTNHVDRWIGSVHLTDGRCWRWDSRAQRLIAP